ncbi:MAG: DUF5339 family protein [Neisseria sp.]|uniref:DUF5339 family protein n=1 Tax=Neisseria sp. TaxID=192066 RepID=UPI0026DC280F|nr:DUF5339 family protein [Neisseria sp.]MDO4640676.1 DUF5339 family protein [Neisseria sp.]
MKKPLFAVIVAAAFALAACGENKNHAPAAPASGGADASAPASGKLSAGCEAYFERMNQCFEKAGGAGESLKAGLAETQKGIMQLSESEQEQSCKAGNEQFNQIAKDLKCE